jgi:hypothetical protein
VDVNVRRTRVLAALVMMAASGSIGVFAGRMSAWILPVEAPRLLVDGRSRSEPAFREAATELRAAPILEKHRGAPSSLGVIEAAIGGPDTSAGRAPPATDNSAPRAPEETNPGIAQEPGKGLLMGTARTGWQTTTTPNPTASAAQPSAPVIINASPAVPPIGSADGVRPAASRMSAADRPNDGEIGQCERRYSSFRRTDGTYQPMDGGARKRCPLLR